VRHVPPIYHGLWQRTLYAEPADGEAQFVDRDTQVFWLQAGDWHADLRVPADRPDFSGVGAIGDCSREQLLWLARQTAFAGITRVEGRFCTWHRLVDLSPGLEKDVGVMRFLDDDTLEERHAEGRYREVWSRTTRTVQPEPVTRFDRAGLPRWLETGDYAMAISPRRQIEPAHDLLADPATLTGPALTERAALEIGFAQRSIDGWRISLSTLPWREGYRIDPPTDV
jgi:hypothetical protein